MLSAGSSQFSSASRSLISSTNNAKDALEDTTIARIGSAPLKPTANINFQPIPTAIGKSRKLRINILLDATIFVAGGTIHGRLELTCSTSRSIRLGLIEVQLQGYEEIYDRELAASKSFLSSNIVFQGDKTPPSNAVRGPKENEFWKANKGKTTFPFAFQLPFDVPSSFDFQTLASLKYVITGVVRYEEGGQTATMFKSKNALVVEQWKTTHPNALDPKINDIEVTDEATGQLFMGGNGQVTLHGKIHKRFVQSGSDVYIETRVKNESRRRIQGMKLRLLRKLVMLQKATNRGADTKVIAEPVSEAVFREKDNIYDPGEDRSNILHAHIPVYVKTVSNAALAEISMSVQVTLGMGMLSKDILIELPIVVYHAASVSPPPVVDVAKNLLPYQYNVVDHDIKSDNEPAGYKNRKDQISPTRVQRPQTPPPGRRLPWSDDEGEENDDQSGYNSPYSGSAGSGSPDRGGKSPVSPDKRSDHVVSSTRIPIAPAYGPAAPTAYVPAIERARYLTGIPAGQRYRTSRAFSPARESVILGEYTSDGVYIDMANIDKREESLNSSPCIPPSSGSLNMVSTPALVPPSLTTANRPFPPFPDPTQSGHSIITSDQEERRGSHERPQRAERHRRGDSISNKYRHNHEERTERSRHPHLEDNRGRTREKEESRRHEERSALYYDAGGGDDILELYLDASDEDLDHKSKLDTSHM